MVGHHLRLLHLDLIHFDIAAHDSFFKAAIEVGVFGNVLTKVPHIILMSNFIFCFTHTFLSFICIRWSDVNCFMPRVFFKFIKFHFFILLQFKASVTCVDERLIIILVIHCGIGKNLVL